MTRCSLVEICRRFRGTWNHNEGGNRLLRNCYDFYQDTLKKTVAWYQASAANSLRKALFWTVTQRVEVIPYGLLGTNSRSQLQGSRNPVKSSWTSLPSNMKTIGCPETSSSNYHYTLHDVSEERRFYGKELRKLCDAILLIFAFRTCPDRPWGPPSLLYNGYHISPSRGR